MSRPSVKYLNTLSSLPMFDNANNINDSTYKTTYSQDFTKKVKYLDRLESQRDLDRFSYVNSNSFGKLSMQPSSQTYNVNSLTSRLKQKELKKSTLNELADEESNNDFAYKSEYFNDPLLNNSSSQLFGSKSCNNFMSQSFLNKQAEPLSESHSSFNTFETSLYKKPKIPSYIKRDSYYQTNSEKSLTYVRTHEGVMMPLAPSMNDATNSKSANNSNNNIQDQFKSNYIVNFVVNCFFLYVLSGEFFLNKRKKY